MSTPPRNGVQLLGVLYLLGCVVIIAFCLVDWWVS